MFSAIRPCIVVFRHIFLFLITFSFFLLLRFRVQKRNGPIWGLNTYFFFQCSRTANALIMLHKIQTFRASPNLSIIQTMKLTIFSM